MIQSQSRLAQYVARVGCKLRMHGKPELPALEATYGDDGLIRRMDELQRLRARVEQLSGSTVEADTEAARQATVVPAIG